MKNKPVRYLTQAGLIAALYIVLTYINPYSFNEVQIRVSEALCVLPLFTPAGIPGLFIGCFVANLLHPGVHILDIIFGSLATLSAAGLTYFLRKNKFVALMPPVLINAVVIGLVVFFCYGSELLLPLTMVSIGVGQLIACYGLGLPLYYALKKASFIFGSKETKTDK